MKLLIIVKSILLNFLVIYPVIVGAESIESYRANQTSEIVQALNNQGVVIIKGAIDPSTLQAYSYKIIQLFNYFDDAVQRLPKEPVGTTNFGIDQTNSYQKQGGFSFSFLMDEHFPIPAGFRQVFFYLQQAGLLTIARTIFNSDVGFLLDGSSARIQTNQKKKKLDFHQDGVGYAKKGLVYWLPLVPIDKHTPTLQVVNHKIDHYFEHTASSHGFSVLKNQADLEPFQKNIVTLDNLELGDVVIFTFNTLHRTYINSNMHKKRFSIDMRCVPVDDISKITGSYLLFK